ncbi:MAG: glucohydrolase, partial [Lachnospiraceae bacterium]|nr:glucohydrolase [Lachnospiraceae bacterium]
LGMTNMTFGSIDECDDVEEINAYRQYVEEHKMISPEEMLKCISAVGRDNARTPVQWNADKNAGFTTGTPWFTVNPNYNEINAEAALADPDSVFYYYQKLIRLRHENDIIVYGTFHPLLEDDENVYAYERRLDGKVLTVACNWTDKEVPCALFDDLSGKELISNYKEHKHGILLPYEARAVLV